MIVFFQTIDKTRSPEDLIKSPGNIKQDLERLKLELNGEKDAEKRKELQRKVKRLERLDAIMEGKGVDEDNKKDVAEVLKGKSADTIRNSDILTLRKKGVDIANLTLVDDSNPDKEIRSSEIKVNDKFTVNFGNNASLRDRTGAGDILPPNVKTITINGVECERRNNPRPGYYNDSKKPPYQKIYDGYKLEILSLGEVKEADILGNEKQWKRERLEDTIENGAKALTSLAEDIDIEKDAQEEIKFRNRYKSMKFSLEDIGSGDRGLLNFIGIAEGTGENYNAIFGDGNQSKQKFTEMTLNEILTYQREYKIGRGSAAIGRYQFMDYTLKAMIERYKIDGDTKFSAETQDKLAFLKLNERGLASFKAGRIGKEDFQINLAREWASIAKDGSGLSYYHGDSMNNHASAAGKQIGDVLDKLYA